MKKKLQNVIASIDARLKKNTLSEDAAALWEEVRAAFEALAEDDAEHTITELTDKYNELAAKYEKAAAEQGEEVAERIQKLRNEVMGMLNGERKTNKLTAELAKEVANAIGNARNDKEAKNAVAAILKKNGIDGLTFGAIIDYSLNIKLEDNEPMYDQLHKTRFTKFFYTEHDRTDAAQIAKQWDKTSESEKAIQELETNDKEISTKYIYKRQQFAQEDLDEIRETGDLQNFLAEISRELRVLVKSGIVTAILVGDNVNTGTEKITSFETIGTKVASDAFTSVMVSDDADYTAYMTGLGVTSVQSALLAAARMLVSRLYNPMGKKSVLCMNKETLTAMAAYVVAAGGDLSYRSRAEVAAMIGVDEIYTTEHLPSAVDLAADAPIFVALLPDGYWVKEKNTIDVAYPQYEKNTQSMQYEINCGGKIHDLLSTGVFILKA